MITYQDYNEHGGTLSQIEFEELEPKVVILFDNYVSENIPHWKILDSLDQYGMDLTKILVEQIDFIAVNGGLSALFGRSDFNIKNVKTSAFSFDVENMKIDLFHNIPLSPIALPMLIKEMRKKGLLYRGL